MTFFEELTLLRAENARLKLDNIQLVSNIEYLEYETEKQKKRAETAEKAVKELTRQIQIAYDIIMKRGQK